ncbi:MAG: hypothetical protein E7480_07895 [Ruminococcaceae bacterium]|nr:hypothetical protein [Oscillospiraceae bacterium]
MNTFYNQMFNPQYVNLQYYRQIEQLQYQAKQNEEVANAVKAIRDLCKAIKELDNQHQMIALSACLAEMAREFNW